MDWQPIETAPKDKPILLLSAPYEEYGVCLWDDYDREWRYWTEDGFAKSAENDFSVDYCTMSVPTHWMPLPEPPRALEG